MRKRKDKQSYERGRLHIDLRPPKSSLSLNPLPQTHFFKWSTMFLASFTVPSTVIRPPASGNFLLRNPKMLHTQPEPHFAVRHAYRTLPHPYVRSALAILATPPLFACSLSNPMTHVFRTIVRPFPTITIAYITHTTHCIHLT